MPNWLFWILYRMPTFELQVRPPSPSDCETRGETQVKTRMRLVPILLLSLPAIGCQLTGHPVMTAQLGVPRSAADLESQLTEPGPVDLETVVAADWQVQLSGLVNLDHP